MTTILFVFIASCLCALVLTPVAGKLALSVGLMDRPSGRKVHSSAVPRSGGVAIFLSFFFPFVLVFFLREQSLAAGLLCHDTRITGFLLGAGIIFLLGLIDDIKNIPWFLKFAGQILAALAACFWGFQITEVSIPLTDGLSLGIFALPVTVFWFVLVINAINLADGLDGLAAGICLFVSLAMLFLCITSQRIVPGLAFAALAGTLLGFLRYNFFPASIFMGDSGSYFLGYCLAALSVAGSIKGQVATAMLIPVIALGVPLIDTLWAPLRRFVFGQRIFQPDREHFHHRLVALGYTQRRAVLLIYAITILLGAAAIGLVHAQDDMAALILCVLGAGVILITRFLCLSDFFTVQRVVGWVKDLSDEAGVSHDRRSFLHFQAKVSRASDLNSLWSAVCESLEFLEFDDAEFVVFTERSGSDVGESKTTLRWHRQASTALKRPGERSLLKVQLPVQSYKEGNSLQFGILTLGKKMHDDPAAHYTLKRIEHLLQAMVNALTSMEA